MTEAASAVSQQSAFRTWAPLIAVCLGFFVVVLDSTMMNVAIPAIAGDLDTTVSGVQGAISLYSMVMASMMLAAGKLGDIQGVKRMFAIGCGIYGVGTLLAAFSWNLGILILGWSVIEGVGAALILPLAFTLIFANYEGARRALAFGVLGGVQAVGAAVGPILGGTLTTYLTWRLGFGIEVVGIVLIFALLPFLKESERDREATLDWVGTLLSIVSLTLIVSGLILAGRYGFWEARRIFTIGGIEISPFGLSITPVLMAFGIGVAFAFAHWQVRRERRGETPLFHLSLFANKDFLAGALADAFRTLFFAGLLFVVPVFVQSAAGFSAVESGVTLIPFSAAVFVLSLTTSGLGRIIAPKFIIQAGLVIMAVGALLYYYAIGADVTIADLIVPGLVFGLGGGLLLPQLTNLTLSVVETSERNEASAVANTMRTLGTALGTAVIGAVLLTGVFGGIVDGVLEETNIEASTEERTELAVGLEDALAHYDDEELEQATAGLTEDERITLQGIVDTAWVDAGKNALLAVAGTVLLSLLATSFLSRKKFEVEQEPITRKPGPTDA